MKLTAKTITQTALFSAIICVLGPLTIPIGPIPLSLCTLAIMITACVAGVVRSLVAVLVYVAIGTIGLPVFSGFTGGVGVLAGPTGGYLVGYLLCALIVSLLARLNTVWVYPVASALGTLALYAFGTAWFVIQTQSNVLYAITVCVLPFLIGDAIKIVVVTLVTPRLRKVLKEK